MPCWVPSNMYAGFTRYADDLPAANENCKFLVLAGDHFVRVAVRWIQGAAYGVLPQEYVGPILEVLVDECVWGCVSCCWGRSQLVHLEAELL